MTTIDPTSYTPDRRSARPSANGPAPGDGRPVLRYGGVRLEAFGELVPISRQGGQGRVFRPARTPPSLGAGEVVVKLYRRPPPAEAASVLVQMVAWERSLAPAQRARLRQVTGWPVAIVIDRRQLVGIVMRDVSPRFQVPFVMPSGRSERVLLALEHLLGTDSYLQMRGLGVRLNTATRALVAERISEALAFLHHHAIVASDIAPTNLLVVIAAGAADVCFIDCDSMVFRGSQALPTVETGDWEMPAAFAEPPRTRATDAYKLGLVVLRLFARSHDARDVVPNLKYVPVELRDLLYRALAADTANRPPAGEWQRALQGLRARGDLNDRYPGPAQGPSLPAAGTRAAVPVFPAPDSVRGLRPAGGQAAPTRRVLVGARRAGSTAGPAPSGPAPLGPAPLGARARARAAAARSRVGGDRRLRLVVMALWLAALAVVIVLILSHLIAAVAPGPTQSTVPQYPYGRNPQTFQYYNPAGPGAGSGGGQLFPGGQGQTGE
jgi:hypothetical protein